MKARIVWAVLSIAVMLLMTSGVLFAEENKLEISTASVIKSVLVDSMGKRVAVRLDAGEELEGTVTKVGDHLVHISKLSKRDFYDAVIRIDKISAVIVRVRGN